MPGRGDRVRRLRDLAGIGVDRMGAAADALAASDPSILRMENLDTDLRPPPAAIQATREAIERDDANSYLPFAGQARLRAAAARRVGEASGVTYEPERNCLITAGGLNGCLAALLALLDPEDEVVLTDPTYVGMINRVRLASGVPVLVPFEWREGRWALDLRALRAAVTPKTKGLFLMSPSMPSGAALDAAEWDAVARLCRESDLWLLYNAAMERILYDGLRPIHPAGLPGMADRTITVGSASKEFRMIGWRVGWVVGPAEILSDVALVAISDVCVPVGIAQPGAAAALESPDSERDLAGAVAEWQRRRDAVVRELEGWPVRGAAGGWSLLLDAGKLGMTGAVASARLLERGRVAATPMNHWGRVHGEQYVRFVFSNEPVERLAGLGERVRRSLT
ncbi:MAG: pyridoxal phosphate-dependent aminotransferase [Thermoanaerobaculia bacterium]